MLELVLVLCLDRIGGMPTRDITLFYPRSGDQTVLACMHVLASS